MSNLVLERFVHDLRVVLSQPNYVEFSDDQLLECYLTCHDSGAFGEVVRRHGSMVLGVCQRILRHHQDAEDAFQATFFVLVQKANTIRPRTRLGAWLHGVAVRTSLRAKTLGQRYRMRETFDEEAVAQYPDRLLRDQEAELILDEELQQLPDKYRLPILLCELQGQTRQHVAGMLGWPEGTVAGRLARARELLAKRLTRRGVCLSVAGLTSFLSSLQVQGSIPFSLLTSTVQMASLIRLGGDIVPILPGSVMSLTDGVMKTMIYSKWKMVALMVACFMTIGFGIRHSLPSKATAQEITFTVKAKTKPDIEPIDANLLFQKPIQQELRLSENQINKLFDAWEKGKVAKFVDQNKIDELDKQIKELEGQLAKLHEQRNKHQQTINESQIASIKQILPDTLSKGAIDRLRQITLQQQSLRSILLDPKFQAKLKLNDEQLKKIQELQDGTGTYLLSTRLREQPTFISEIRFINTLFVSSESKEELRKILNDSQRKLLDQMLGQPYTPKEEEKK